MAIATIAFACDGSAAIPLHDVADRARIEWRAAGGALREMPTRFVFEDETIVVRVPPGPPSTCTSIGLIGSRGMSFHAEVPGERADDEDVARAASVAGILEITRCDGEPLERIVVTSDAGRGALEVVVARSKNELPSLRSIYPERTGGMFPPMPEPGAFPPLPPAEKRAEAAEARVISDGAAVLPRKTLRVEEDGTGSTELELGAGCHRLELFAVEPRPQNAVHRVRLDLDAELRDADDDALLARDRSEATDARLETCVGGPLLSEIVFAGAIPNGAALLTHVAWPIPDRLPRLWGNVARARMAHALLVRHVHAPREEPFGLAQGPAGSTPTFVEIEPGSCYVAVAAITRGTARGFGLRAVAGATEATDEHGGNDDAAAVSFCAHDEKRVRIDVDARGASLSWGLAVFRTVQGAWELSR